MQRSKTIEIEHVEKGCLIYFDSDFIVVNKPPGVATHGGFSVLGPTVVDFLLEKFPEIKGVGEDPERAGIAHRLDKDTSGVLVVARNQKSFSALKSLFQERRIEKTYLAIVCGLPKKARGVISFPLGRLAKHPLKRGVGGGRNKIRGERAALTEYTVLQKGNGYALLQLKPKTGRMHQLRVHLKAVGHPVACDRLYGGKKVCCPEGAHRMLLHAKSLSFSFPEGRRLYFEADPPHDFQVAIESLF